MRDSTPERRRQRYGDMEYDWEHRVNTTSGTVGWRARLLGLFYSPYQPTEPALFREMMASLPIAFDQFTFVDLGSGKGRTLLMASEYPFRRIVGVESIAELHRAAEQNIRAYRSPTQRCAQIEAVCADASEFVFPEAPLVLYLFNPLPEAGLRRVIRNLEHSLELSPRPVWIVYHNPAMDSVWQRRGAGESRRNGAILGVHLEPVSRLQGLKVSKTESSVTANLETLKPCNLEICDFISTSYRRKRAKVKSRY